jgi:transposase InsO family protein
MGGVNRCRYLFSNTPLYNADMKKYIQSVKVFSASEKAKYRLKVIEFHNKYGTLATKDAFNTSKATIYRWKKILKDNHGRLSSLVPLSTAPKHPRIMMTDQRIVLFIKQIRKNHPRLGKEKIKPLLDEYCQKQAITSISQSTIGKLIKRHNLLSPKRYGRYYHNPADKRAQKQVKYKTKVKRSPKPKEFGYLEIDAVVKFIDGMKLYIFNAVDIKLKFQFSYAYSRLNSKNGADFLSKLLVVYPIRKGIKTIQTDNGLEFKGEFHRYLKKHNINHLFIYPRCPKINSFVERSNRSLQEEFVNDNLDLAVSDLNLFNHKLTDYLIWYNTKRVHKSLNNISPIDYLLSVSPESQKWVTYTSSCKKKPFSL